MAMSEETSTEQASQPTGEKWGDPIDEARKQALWARLHAWWEEIDHDERKGPFAGVRLTGAEVFWLAVDVVAKLRSCTIVQAEKQLRAAYGDSRMQLSLRLSMLSLQGANLSGAQLERAVLGEAQLTGANLREAQLAGAYLREAQLERANLLTAQLAGANLVVVNLERANLGGAHLERANLRAAQLMEAGLGHAHLLGADLGEAHMERAYLSEAQLVEANLSEAHLVGADLSETHMERADLSKAHLEQVNLSKAHLAGANLSEAHLEQANLNEVQLVGADLRRASLDGKTRLVAVTLCRHECWWRRVKSLLQHREVIPFLRLQRVKSFLWRRVSAPALGDISWQGVGTVDLTQIADWDWIQRLGDERFVSWRDGADTHQAVVRAYRQVATQLRAQGMSEVADRLSHRALSYERRVFLRRGNIPRYLSSWFLAILAGYGYRPLYTLFWYLVVVLGFAFGYYEATHGLLTFGLAHSQVQPLQWFEALVLSVSAFHGRGFFQPIQSLGDPVAILAAVEAIVGLIIEISFIATFTQR